MEQTLVASIVEQTLVVSVVEQTLVVSVVEQTLVSVLWSSSQCCGAADVEALLWKCSLGVSSQSCLLCT